MAGEFSPVPAEFREHSASPQVIGFGRALSRGYTVMERLRLMTDYNQAKIDRAQLILEGPFNHVEEGVVRDALTRYMVGRLCPDGVDSLGGVYPWHPIETAERIATALGMEGLHVEELRTLTPAQLYERVSADKNGYFATGNSFERPSFE